MESKPLIVTTLATVMTVASLSITWHVVESAQSERVKSKELYSVLASSLAEKSQSSEPVVIAAQQPSLQNPPRKVIAKKSATVVEKKTPVVKVAPKNSLPRPSFSVTPEVESELARLTKSERRVIVGALKNRRDHYDEMVQAFRSEGVPEELISVAVVESGCNNLAKNESGATGMWQLMQSTAEHYGLRVTDEVDQREDPHHASRAAAKYLRALYGMFGDWNLVLAAYNAGHGTVEKALAKADGDSIDFWALAHQGLLKAETIKFVPRVIAITLILNDPRAYGMLEVAKLRESEKVVG